MPLPTGIWSLVAAIIGLIREVRRHRAQRLRPTPRQQAELDAHAARTASATGDAEAVNAQAERWRIRKALGALLAASALSGCTLIGRQTKPPVESTPDHRPAVVVVSADRWQYPMTNSYGTVGWFVPAAVHAEYCEAVSLLHYYQDKERAK